MNIFYKFAMPVLREKPSRKPECFALFRRAVSPAEPDCPRTFVL